MITVVSPVNIEKRQEIGICAGDTVRVHQKIEDKGKTRVQVFEGLVLARKHGNEAGATFTVRKVVGGVGVEKVFPLYSPKIDKIEIVKRSKVRRAKLYYIREKAAKEIRRQMRRAQLVSLTTEVDKKEVAPEAVDGVVEEAEDVEENSGMATDAGVLAEALVENTEGEGVSEETVQKGQDEEEREEINTDNEDVEEVKSKIEDSEENITEKK
jgi:large subunit ribosomal protein L19